MRVKKEDGPGFAQVMVVLYGGNPERDLLGLVIVRVLNVLINVQKMVRVRYGNNVLVLGISLAHQPEQPSLPANAVTLPSRGKSCRLLGWGWCFRNDCEML